MTTAMPPPNPMIPNPMTANPVTANSVTANPMAALPPDDSAGRIARFAAAVAAEPGGIPPPVADRCGDLMLNAAAAALAAAAVPDGIALARIAREMGGNGRSTIIGMGQRTSPVYAALVNGALVRMLDFDDYIPGAGSRPTAAVFPAVLALGEMHGSSGPALRAAFAAGVEIVARLSTAGDAISAAAGAVGAATASAMLLNSDADAIAHAVALAAGAADAGVAYENAGATALSAGRAAMHGVMAALQANAGIAARFAPGAGRDDAGPAGGALDGLGAGWRLVEPGVAIPLYPCHPAAHSAVDAILGIAQLHRFAPEDVAGVHIGVTPDSLALLPYAMPADGWQARSCLGFIAAAALRHGAPLINFFSDVAVRDAGVRAMQELVSVEASLSVTPLSPHPAEVAVTLRDGRVLRHRVDHPRGTPAMPLDAEELEAKFLYCTRYILPADHIEEAVGSFRNIAEIENVTGMVSVLGG